MGGRFPKQSPPFFPDRAAPPMVVRGPVSTQHGDPRRCPHLEMTSAGSRPDSRRPTGNSCAM